MAAGVNGNGERMFWAGSLCSASKTSSCSSKQLHILGGVIWYRGNWGFLQRAGTKNQGSAEGAFRYNRLMIITSTTTQYPNIPPPRTGSVEEFKSDRRYPEGKKKKGFRKFGDNSQQPGAMMEGAEKERKGREEYQMG